MIYQADPCAVSAAACQRSIDHMYRVEFGAAGWVLHLVAGLVGNVLLGLLIIAVIVGALTGVALWGLRWIFRKLRYL